MLVVSLEAVEMEDGFDEDEDADAAEEADDSEVDAAAYDSLDARMAEMCKVFTYTS
jgi:hypothetical protein